MYFFDHEKEVTVRNRYRYGHPWLPVDLLESTSTIDLTRVGINYHHDLLLVRVGFIIKFLSFAAPLSPPRAGLCAVAFECEQRGGS